MKSIKFLSFIFFIIFFSCSNDENMKDEFTIEIVFLNNDFEVDKPISFNLKSNQDLISFSASTSNTGSLQANMSNYGKTTPKINVSFDKVGINTIYVSIQNDQNEILTKEYDIEVKKGESVKIIGVKVISFKNIDGVWDPEYSNSDINRLADLKFSLEKSYINTSFYDQINYYTKMWHLSSVLENQGNLMWDLSDKGLYINPNFRMYFGIVDIDENGSAEDLLLGPPGIIEINLDNYIQSKPNRITLEKTDIELEVEFELEWW